MIAKIKRAEPLADLIEVRFDCLDNHQINFLIREIERGNFTRPLLATFRSSDQGGNNSATLADRIAFWENSQIARFESVDVEEDVFDAVAEQQKRIVSFHDFDKVPEDLANVFERLSSLNADVVKIATRADDITDSIPVWKFLEQTDKKIVSVAMGEAGKWTRILGLAHGVFLTYASLDEGDETADGQITAKDMIEAYRVKELDKNTYVYGVIGDPVSSSKSPFMHNAAFAASGINAVFLPLLVKNLDEFIRRMVAPETREVELNFAGLSVTMPHKQTIMKHLDEIDETAKQIGAVNTVKIENDKLIGYNTDAHGFITPLKKKFGDLKNARVAVIGAGGAARAVVYALKNEGADVTVMARDLQKAESFKKEFEVKLECLPIANGQLPKAADIVVNATPLGMTGELENASPLTADQLKGVKFVYDLVTRADDTPLVSDAKKAGIAAIGGLEMLIAQGVKQFEIWTGGEAPTDVMRQSVINRLTKNS